MNFKELKSGYPLYILDRNGYKFSTGKVIAVSTPHLDAKIGGTTTFVVDVDAEVDGKRTTFCMIADTDIAYPTGQVLSTTREAIAREVEAIKTTSEQALAQMDSHKEAVERCKELLAELDPRLKEKQVTEQRFTSLEASIEKLARMIEQVIN